MNSSVLPVISVGVLNYNGLQYLKRVIPALLELEYPHFEVIVLDNGSRDGSVEYLQRWGGQVRLILNSSNEGYCRGKNQLVRDAKGKYVLLLDEDLLINDRGALHRLLEIYQKYDVAFLTVLAHNEGEATTPYIGGFWGWLAYGIRPQWSVEAVMAYPEEVIKVHVPEGHTVFFEKELFEKIGGYDEQQPYYLDVGDIGLRSNILTTRANYCYLRMCFVHLGIGRRNDIKRWSWNLRYMFPGAMRILLKNFTIFNVVRYTPTIAIFYFSGSLVQSVRCKSVLVMKSFLWSLWFFLKSLPSTLEERRGIQEKRVIPTDSFLRIKRPNFD